ncbi:MAG: cysteine desulfurase NifS [Clostridia bacterium]|jgi:cysteine desulfurase|nr:cysteine desulfurase NifS [Clostridia bacterium]
MIYFDNAATTMVRKEVAELINDRITNVYGNPSSVYKIGRESKSAIEDSREKVAKVFGAEPREIFFTSSGTESDNWAIKGFAYANKKKGNHIITSKIEHHAVLHTCEYLEKNGFEVTYLDVDADGKISLDELRNAIKDNTILVSIMYANNEIGTVQPIKEIGAITREKGVVFHTDAVQAAGHIEIDVNDQNIDMLSISGHKFNAPKGIGALYVKRGIKLENLIHGGGQERGKRPSTENIIYIEALALALELAEKEREEETAKLIKLRDYYMEKMESSIDHIKLNGHKTDRLPGNTNYSFSFIEGESLLLLLDMKGFAASSGSACTSGSLDPSHVLMAIGLPHEIAHGSLRVTFGKYNTKEEIDELFKVLPDIINRLREMSPLYEDYKKGGK